MDEQIIKLAKAREQFEAAKSRRAELLAAVTNGEAYRDDTQAMEQAQAEIAEATREIQAAALDAYLATGSKKPHPAIGIRETTTLTYDVDKALTWARSNLLAAVTLDRKLFETHAKAVVKTQPLDFVQIVKVPGVTIATDLSEWVTAEPEPDDHQEYYEEWANDETHIGEDR